MHLRHQIVDKKNPNQITVQKKHFRMTSRFLPVKIYGDFKTLNYDFGQNKTKAVSRSQLISCR